MKGVWKQESEETIIINVYSPCNLAGKIEVWNSIKDLRNRWGTGMWCVLGDFNAVRKSEEREGRLHGSTSRSRREITELNKFIEELELHNIPLTGRRFTWYKAGGEAKSRIDIVLVS